MQRIRLYIIELILMGILFLSVGFFGYLGYGLLLPDDNPNFSGEEALAHVNTQLKYGPRITGSERSQSMSTWLVEELSQEGWDVVIQPFVVPLSGDAAALSIEGNFSDESANSTEGEEPDTPEMAEAAEAVARNIIAIQEPFARDEEADPEQEADVILLITAYDSRHWDDILPNETRKAVPGANSAASGTAVLLELARSLHVEDTEHIICLAFLDNEANHGLDGWSDYNGSQHLIEHLDQDVGRCTLPQVVIAVDTVGNGDHQLFVDTRSTLPLSLSIWSVATELGYDRWFGERAEDHASSIHTLWRDASIPTVLMMDNGYRYGDTASDTFDKVSAQSLSRVGRTLEVWLERGASWEE